MIDQVLGGENYELAKKMLDAAVLRHEALATNLANLETPGFKRIDLAPDFVRELNSLSADSDPEKIGQLEPRLAQDTLTKAVRPDGNNVQLDRELLDMNQNALEYEFLTQYASDSIKRLKTAVTGRIS